jgi:hypothetical protein
MNTIHHKVLVNLGWQSEKTPPMAAVVSQKSLFRKKNVKIRHLKDLSH